MEIADMLICVTMSLNNAVCMSKKRKGKTTQAMKTLPTSIKEKRVPRAEAPCNPLHQEKKRKRSMGIRRLTSSTPCLILVIRVESAIKSAPGAINSISVLDSMSMKLQSKHDGFMSVKNKLFKGL
eukprot:1152218-Pelagomonas_calceolata.AAC.2